MKILIQFECFLLQCSLSFIRAWRRLMTVTSESLNNELLIANGLCIYSPSANERNPSRLNEKLGMQSLAEMKLPSLVLNRHALSDIGSDKAHNERYQATNTINNKNRSALVDQLVAGIAHEINNPLSVVSSNLNTLQEYAGSLNNMLTQQQQLIERFSTQQTLSRIEIMALNIDSELSFILNDLDTLIGESMAGVGRVKKIVKDLSGVAPVSTFDSDEEDINQLLDDALGAVNTQFKSNIRFIKKYDELMVSRVSAKKLNQAFLALINNAVQAVDNNGEVILQTTRLKQHLRIDVIDDGCGIAEETLNTVFEPFYTTRKVGEGVGLGLHMAQNIAESHGGALSVSSKVGTGTVLTMILPISDSAASGLEWPMNNQV